MITGKHSSLKGFALLFYVLISLMAMIGCCLAGKVFIAAGLLNLLINGYVIYRLYRQFSDGE